MQFVVFEKFTSAYLFQIAREKSFEYLLIIYKWQFLSRFSILRDKWRQQATSTNLTCEFKRENSFTLSKSCIKTEQFLFTVKSSLYVILTVELENLTTKQRKKSLRLWCGFLAKCFSSGWETVCKKLLNLVQVALTKIPRNEAKIYQETEFHSSEGYLFKFSWLDLPLEVFTAFC